MDNSIKERNADGLIVFRFPKYKRTVAEPEEGFFPLRLHMRPGTVCIELTASGLVLGRHSAADVRLSLPDISRRHCRFAFTDGLWEVQDLDSLNGLCVNGERLKRSVLCHGDTLRIASMNFVVEMPAQVGQTSTQGNSTALIQRLARVLPGPDPTQEYRKAS